MHTLRKHQNEIGFICDEIISGVFRKPQVVLDCTPGGGKTGAAGIMASRLLDAGLIDRVLWLVPRLSLAEQVVDSFAQHFGASTRRAMTVVDGQDQLFPTYLPPGQLVGHVATYQAVASKSNWQRFRDALRTKRSLLIADSPPPG